MSREEEALTKRYEFRASVTPLEDGSFAVFALDFSEESMLIVDDVEELVLAIVSRANMKRRKSKTDFDDIDFSQALDGET